jgi:hypothetical protein
MNNLPSPKNQGSYHPVSTVVGIIDQPERAQAALEALHTLGFPKDAVAVICGPQGARQLNVQPQRLGLLRRIAQIVQPSGEHQLLPDTRHIAAIQDGHLCVCVNVETLPQRESARQAIKAHGGHTITYHGLNETTLLDE